VFLKIKANSFQEDLILSYPAPQIGKQLNRLQFKKREMPDQIKLNIMVNGVGTVWIDDIHLSKL